MTSQAPNHRTPALLGYSRGSMTAEVAAQRRPKSISALVLYGFPVDLKVKIEPVPDPTKPPREKTTAEGAGSLMQVTQSTLRTADMRSPPCPPGGLSASQRASPEGEREGPGASGRGGAYEGENHHLVP